MIQELVNFFEKTSISFLKEQKAFISSGISERSLCGELMKYLTSEIRKTTFSDYHVDVEYNRNKGKKKTILNERRKVIPITSDIIIHSRGENIEQDNLIAIEMKKSSHPQSEKNQDRKRLIALTKNFFDDIWIFDGTTLPDHVCRYVLGVYYEINLELRIVEIEYYHQGKLFLSKLESY
ncbi:hypothetical protein DFO69_0111 [Bacillus subtilis]|nr:hypothetical protein DFO69_0111 [Bacillus subtilis]CUB30296.1 hypothetical protein BN2127_JRS1_09242 [Bacillus cereus]